MSEERIKERCKREDIALKIVKGFLEKDCYIDTELEYSLNTLLNLYNKQKEEIERLKNAEEYAKLGKETLLDAIHKQQKEIKELKDIKDMVQVLFDNKLPKERLILITNDHLKNTGFKYLLDNYISKDKIRDKIKELEEKAEKVKEYYRGTYACLDEYLNAKSKIQGYKELLEEG